MNDLVLLLSLFLLFFVAFQLAQEVFDFGLRSFKISSLSSTTVNTVKVFDVSFDRTLTLVYFR